MSPREAIARPREIFLPFFLVFAVFGTFKDYYDGMKRARGWMYGINETMLYYPASTAAYGLLASNWFPFVAFMTYTTVYDLTKLIYLKRGVG